LITGLDNGSGHQGFTDADITMTDASRPSLSTSDSSEPALKKAKAEPEGKYPRSEDEGKGVASEMVHR